MTGIIRSSRITQSALSAWSDSSASWPFAAVRTSKPFELQEPLEHLARVGIVLDDHHGRHGSDQADRRPRAAVISVFNVRVRSAGSQGFARTASQPARSAREGSCVKGA